MPNHKSTAKRLKTNELRRLRNRATKSRIRTLSKSLQAFVTEGKNEEAQKTFRTTVSAIDKAAKKHRLHRNTAARKKSRLARLVGGMS